MKFLPKRLCRAFTLAEAVVAMGSGTIVLAAITTAGVALQRSFAAVENYSAAEGDQLRVADYISMDCRRATSATVSNGVLTLTVPLYYNTTNQNNIVPYSPSLNNLTGAIQYGSGSVTIAYSTQTVNSQTNFVRSVTSNGTTTTTTIARNVASFTVAEQDLTASMSCTIMFFPTFTRSTGIGTWRSGGSVPNGSIGSDGDYYVVDPTSATSSSIGDVYYRSGGNYSRLNNIKATTVYCNTFFRNAAARQ